MKQPAKNQIILSDFIKGESSQLMKAIAVLANSALMLMVLAVFGLMYIDHEPTTTLLNNIVGFSGLFVMLAIIPLGLRYISRNESRPIIQVMLKVGFYMFLIPAILTAILFAVGWFFHWDGINPK